jgi:ferritin-like metal-binding protein YciE
MIHQLQDLYDAEHKITEALPKLAQKVEDPKLKSAFELHLRQTENHIARLEKCFNLMGEPAERIPCKGIDGLLKEGEELIEENPSMDVLEAGLIGAAQKVEHYEMASYGCARTWARNMRLTEVADLLQKTLDEEGDTDKKLTELAQKGGINREAMHAA